MSYRAILVPVGQADDAASAIETAFLVAKRFAGHVRALHVLPDLADPATHALIATRMSLEAATSDFRRFKSSAERELRRQAGELKRQFEAAAGHAAAPIRDHGAAIAGLAASWREATGFESELVARLGRIFDLTVIARGSSHDTVQAGCWKPVGPCCLRLLQRPRRSAIRSCWPGTRAPKRRAPRRTRCRFCRAPRGSWSCRSATGTEPAPKAHELAAALAWHGIDAEASHIEQGSRRIRDILLAEATAMGADLLVIGAYSHSRLRQVVFGGVTEHMLDHAELPVLMAH